jgi:hypothetical protein
MSLTHIVLLRTKNAAMDSLFREHRAGTWP